MLLAVRHPMKIQSMHRLTKSSMCNELSKSMLEEFLFLFQRLSLVSAKLQVPHLLEV
jgi:hypothetical protein